MKAIYFEGEIEDNYLGHIMAEIWKDRVYAPFVEGKSGLTVVDIGANVGLTTLYFSKYADKVYSIEPSSAHMACLKEMVKSNGLENKVVPIQKAVYSSNGKLPLGGPEHNYTMRSLHMSTWQDGKPIEEVETITLDKLVEDYEIKKIDLLKLDIEGSEQEVIGHSSFAKVAPIISTLVMEVHQWNGRNPNQLMDALELAGFNRVAPIPNDANIIVAQK